MRRNIIGSIWIGGVIVAALLYVVGPDGFLGRIGIGIRHLEATLDDLMLSMSMASFDLLRSAAIALYCVFVLLTVIAIRRGLRGKWALVAVSLLFFVLVGTGHPGSSPRWLLAFVLVGVGAGTMTNRLRHASVQGHTVFRY